jgi:hypothetical protein
MQLKKAKLKNYDSLIESHLEFKRTYIRMIQDSYWPEIYKDVRLGFLTVIIVPQKS